MDWLDYRSRLGCSTCAALERLAVDLLVVERGYLSVFGWLV